MQRTPCPSPRNNGQHDLLDGCYLYSIAIRAATRNPARMEEATMRLAAHMRSLRRRKGWSQERLAEETGLHRTYIAGIERGLRNPSLKNIVKIALALGVTPASLLDAYQDSGNVPKV